MDKEGEGERDSLTEEPSFGEEASGGDARRFPFRFGVEHGTLVGSSESASEISEFLEDGV